MGIKEQFESPFFKGQRNDCCWSSFYPDTATGRTNHTRQVPSSLNRVLGVLLNPQLSRGDHIDRAVSSCASSKFALRTLRALGLRPQELHLVARAITVASLQYTSPAWWGLATEEQRNRLERLLRGLRRCGFLPADFPSFAALATEAELRLFKSISANPYHVYSGIISGIESPPGTVFAPERTASLCLQKMTEMLYPVYYTGS